MNSICPKKQCTGCAACVNTCPKGCISMVPDAEGFLYPHVDREYCTECGMCMRICPVLNPIQCNDVAMPRVYACWNRDESIRSSSSSGGMFTALAEQVIDAGGVVFGVAFDGHMRVKHVAAETHGDLARLRGSKYVQSYVGLSYVKAEAFLRRNKAVMFFGTPCQIAALRASLGQIPDNLITCDLLCHGVPSPDLFAKYIGYLERRFGARVTSVDFRHKRIGWQLPSTVATFDNGRQIILNDIADSFMYGFSRNLSLRPACYRCTYASSRRIGDVTIGDFWGIGESAPFHHHTRNGVSLVLANSEKGIRLLENGGDKFVCQERTLDEARRRGMALVGPRPEPRSREQFFADYAATEFEELARKHLVDRGYKRLIKRTVPRTWVHWVQRHIQRLGCRHST